MSCTMAYQTLQKTQGKRIKTNKQTKKTTTLSILEIHNSKVKT